MNADRTRRRLHISAPFPTLALVHGHLLSRGVRQRNALAKTAMHVWMMAADFDDTALCVIRRGRAVEGVFGDSGRRILVQEDSNCPGFPLLCADAAEVCWETAARGSDEEGSRPQARRVCDSGRSSAPHERIGGEGYVHYQELEVTARTERIEGRLDP
jgi:hypothetical protein